MVHYMSVTWEDGLKHIFESLVHRYDMGTRKQVTRQIDACVLAPAHLVSRGCKQLWYVKDPTSNHPVILCREDYLSPCSGGLE